MQIKTKVEFYQKWYNMELGNRIRMWNSLTELINSDYRGKVSIRSSDKSSLFKAYYVPVDNVRGTVAGFVAQGASQDEFKFNESAPDDDLLIQGEIQYLVGGLHLTYDTQKVPMRKAMEHPALAVGFRATCLLKHYMRPTSYEMIQELFDLYPDSVIEFGAYAGPVGVLPGHNVLIWEVRDY